MVRKISNRNIEEAIQNISKFTNTQEKRNCLKPIFQENNKKIEEEEIMKRIKEVTKITKKREVSILELTKLLKDIEKEIKRLHPYYRQKELLNDHRSNSVKNGDYIIQCKGELYHMDTFRGVVVGTRTNSLWPTRIWIKMLLRNNKYVSFFIDDNGDIKKGTYIEVIGVCYLKKNKNKPISYYNIYAKGGYRIMLSPDEINKQKNGVCFEEIKTDVIPELLLSERKVTKPIHSKNISII